MKKQSSRTLLLLASASYFGMFQFSDSWLLFIFRGMEGLLLGLYLTKQSMEISKENNSTQSLAYLNSASSIGVFLGPLIVSAFINSNTPLSSFLIPGLLCLLVFILFRSDSKNANEPRESKHFNSSLLSREAISLLITFFIFDFTYGFLSFTSSFTLKISFQEDAALATAYLLTIGFIIFSLFMPIFGKVVNNNNSKCLLMTSLSAIVICFVALTQFLYSKPLVYLSFITEYIFASLAYCCVLSRMSNVHENIFSIGGAIQSTGMIAGPLIASYLMTEVSLEFAYVVLAAIYAITCVLSAGLLSNKVNAQVIASVD